MGLGRKAWFGAMAAGSLLATLSVSGEIGDRRPPEPRAKPVGGAVTLLSYNVEGLPWPLTHGRAQAAEEIATQLRALRRQGEQPQIVAVQEAFGAAQKAIGTAAGYRYVAYGPSAGMVSPTPASNGERAFLTEGRVLKGETEGAWEDSGLAIFSDLPILWTKRMPFPRYACAGFDCLANKGILAVALRAPGRKDPLIVVDTHLNSRTASRVDDARSLEAYRSQVDLVSKTVRTLGGTGSPVVLAGDFNVGNDPARRIYLTAALGDLDRMAVGASEAVCGATCRVVASVPSVARSKTIIFYRGSSTPSGPAKGFGSLADGRRLSDHVGVMQAFGLRT